MKAIATTAAASALALLCALVLTACGASRTTSDTAVSNDEAIAASTASQDSVPSVTTTPTTTAIGWLHKAIGQNAELLNEDGTVAVQFKVTAIGGCYGNGYPGEAVAHGLKRIVVHETMRYTSDYDQATAEAQVDPWSMQAITRDGTTVTDIVPDSTWECVPQPDDLASVSGLYEAGHTYSGAMELDVPADTVRLELPIGSSPGWYWTMP